jgi:hypothetical protein
MEGQLQERHPKMANQGRRPELMPDMIDMMDMNFQAHDTEMANYGVLKNFRQFHARSNKHHIHRIYHIRLFLSEKWNNLS